jgi:hypothetical protein
MGVGSCSITLVRNGSNVTGAISLSATTTLASTSLSQAVALNDKIQVTLSSLSAAADLQLTMWLQR